MLGMCSMELTHFNGVLWGLGLARQNIAYVVKEANISRCLKIIISLQTPSYKINSTWVCKVQHDKYNQHCCTLYMKAERLNPKHFLSQGKNMFYFF